MPIENRRVQSDKPTKKQIAIVGGGPSALFMYKFFVDSASTDYVIHIFEATHKLGAGMPYSKYGANHEHVTNVSGNEIPDLIMPLKDWMASLPTNVLHDFNIDIKKFNDYKVVPRLLFGNYLAAQFDLYIKKGKALGLTTTVHLNSKVIDIKDHAERNIITLTVAENEFDVEFDYVIICTGHNWPKMHEGVVNGYFDSPYPPAKLEIKLDHPVAITGASLTAIDAIRTFARHNGSFLRERPHKLSFVLHEHATHFKIVMHSRHGLLPAIRFHLDDPHLAKDNVLSHEELAQNMKENDGFLSLDFVFENNFKKSFIDKDPSFYDHIKYMNIEAFVDTMMGMRESIEPFLLFKGEYKEAEKSIQREQSIYWKEMLAVLSFTMNHPAKYLAAEDMLRLQKVLMPLISLVIAFVPQESCEELIALYEAGVLEIVSVGSDSDVRPQPGGGVMYTYFDQASLTNKTVNYKTYVNCTGQPHLSLNAFPFKSLITNNTLSQARLKFRSTQAGAKIKMENDELAIEEENGNYFLPVAGIAINDSFQVVDNYGAFNSRIYIMAVPYIGGYNPDYSGLDFCEAASSKIGKSIKDSKT